MGWGSGFLVGGHRRVGGSGLAFGFGEAHGLHPAGARAA